MSFEEIDAKFTVLLPHGISNLTPVQWGKATVGKNGQLINVQDYIEYNSQASTSIWYSHVYDLYVLLFCRWHW